MSKRASLIFALLLILSNLSIAQEVTLDKVIYTTEDSLLYVRIWNRTQGNMLSVGRYLLDVPYVGGTLEGNPSEQLVVNLRQVDCTTLVEQVLAIHRSGGTFAGFCTWLQQLRYEGGKIEGYASRLHYTTAWIKNAEREGVLSDITKDLGGCEEQKVINFMSCHCELYPAMDEQSLMTIKTMETNISKQPRYVIAKAMVKQLEDKIEDGDIIGITTATDGLDIAHVGIACHDIDGTLKMLHASSNRHKVTFTNRLCDYLEGNSNFTGIVVLRCH